MKYSNKGLRPLPPYIYGRGGNPSEYKPIVEGRNYLERIMKFTESGHAIKTRKNGLER
jgi:hypothetical protein